ncbi:MAG TPA: CmcI family methyltransferase [Acidimicrobiales bacterium]|nr:CmcI family methyltransferase [Acidimicrobiales bacterium]
MPFGARTRERARSGLARIRTPREYRRRYASSTRRWMLDVLYNDLTQGESRWMGVRCMKNPLDVWIYQEILHEVRPEVLVELGSAFGGSTLMFCHLLDVLGGDTPVVSVDHSHQDFRADHPRIVKVTGDTRDPEVIAAVHSACGNRRGLVIHDADHNGPVVLEDLRNYFDLVAPGSYLIVEDGVRDYLAGLPGPVSAVEAFLAEVPGFTIDESRERYLLTFNPKGFLRRTA